MNVYANRGFCTGMARIVLPASSEELANFYTALDEMGGEASKTHIVGVSNTALSEFEHRETDYMDVVRDCMESRAGELLRQQREEHQKIPVYPYPASYAREHGELEQYRASHRANIDCEVAIENAIAENYQNNVLPDAAAQQVVDLFGFDRTMFVLANTVREKDHDGRISRDNKEWAKTIPVFEDVSGGRNRRLDYVIDRSHPGLVDIFVRQVRRAFQLTQPLTSLEIANEAHRICEKLQSLREPNSHNHIIWNSTTLDCKHKFRDFCGSWRSVSRLSDLLCISHQLSVLQQPTRYAHTHYGKWLGNRAKPSNREQLRIAIDAALSRHPHTFDAFLELLRQDGYIAKPGKQLALCKEGQKAIRLDSLKDGYTEDDIRAVIAGQKQHRPRKKRSASLSENIQRVIDLETVRARDKGIAYERWATNFNSKAASKSLYAAYCEEQRKLKELLVHRENLRPYLAPQEPQTQKRAGRALIVLREAPKVRCHIVLRYVFLGAWGKISTNKRSGSPAFDGFPLLQEFV